MHSSAFKIPSPLITGFCWKDWIIFLVFLIYGLLEVFDWSQGMFPFVCLTGDAATMGSYAAWWLWPERLAGDSMVANQYFTGPIISNIPFLLQLGVGKIIGDPGTSFMYLNPVVLLLQGIGFYLLGRRLFNNRGYAFILVVATFIAAPLTEWQVYSVAYPRGWYQSLFPFIILLLLKIHRNPQRWPILFLLLGLTMYIHPASAPPVAGACWTALLIYPNPDIQFWERFKLLLVSGLLYLAVTVPFFALLFEFSEVVQSFQADTTTYAEMTEALRFMGYAQLGPVKYASIMFSQTIVRTLLTLGVVGLSVVFVLDSHARPMVILLVVWVAGLLFSALFLPFLEEKLGREFQFIPLSIEIVRGLKFCVPIATIGFLWGLFTVGNYLTHLRKATIGRFRLSIDSTVIIATAVVMIWGGIVQFRGHTPWFYAWYQFVPFLQTADCWMHGSLRCPRKGFSDRLPILNFLQSNVKQGSKVLPFTALQNFPNDQSSIGAAIRYFSRLPLVFSHGDYAQHVLLGDGRPGVGWKKWREITKRYLSIYETQDAKDRVTMLLDFGRDLSADIIVVDFPIRRRLLGQGGRILFEGGGFTAINLTR